MPNYKQKKITKKNAPPIDWLWAAVLERKMVYGLDLKIMSEICGVSYPTMRRYIGCSPWTWKPEARTKLCKALGITAIQSVRLSDPGRGAKGDVE